MVQIDRRTREVRDDGGVRARFGVAPASIPDWLALVGDAADGYPGLPGWGVKSAATAFEPASVSYRNAGAASKFNIDVDDADQNHAVTWMLQELKRP